LVALLGRDPRSGDRSHLPRLHSYLLGRSWYRVLLRPAPSPWGAAFLVASRRQKTHTFLPRNSDTGLASASLWLLVFCLRAASSSWTPLHPLPTTGPPGTALYCRHGIQILVSNPAYSPEAPAPSEPRQTLQVVEVNQPPFQAPGRCAATPPGHPCSLRADTLQVSRLAHPGL
jgi:hypothetical protein